ncbi:MAG: sugar ABC transporter ATP-binding protein [Oscillospiraceae bacterium]|jgi:ABC-type sugar transport system ATPase subunit|nr:sugar ABC transporter ATP-binding protein [Oscillospiraceae bacterium]
MAAILELKGIRKEYPGVVALDDFSISFEEGEIHSIMGENGAGKSTMIKIITGAIPADCGKVIINGRAFEKLNPAISKENGIGAIYQEFNMIPSLSVAENIFLGDKTGNAIMPDFKFMHRRAGEIMNELGVNIDSRRMVGELTTAQQQLVEIAKAIGKKCRVLIMDEPSASIAMAEVENMFRIVRQLKASGVTVIYISHRIDEVFQISDRVSVMRDGRYIATKPIRDVTKKELIAMMVGRELTESFPGRSAPAGEPVLEVENLSGNGDFHISLELRKGEILGLGGLVGAGRTELAKMLAGDIRPSSGEIRVNGRSVRFRDSSQAIEAGIGLVPEDRKLEGVFLNYTIEWNIPVMSLKSISKFGVIDFAKAKALAEEYSKRLMIKTPSLRQLVRNLSGGNQQKVAVAKVLAAKTNIIIFDEPTRGIDVGAKQEIYRLMNELAEQGMSIMMISSEMEELLGMSDRIVVLHEGRVSGELKKEEFSQERVLELSSGI